MYWELEFIQIAIDKLIYDYCQFRKITCSLDEMSPEVWNALSPQQKKEVEVLNELWETFAETATGFDIMGE